MGGVTRAGGGVDAGVGAFGSDFSSGSELNPSAKSEKPQKPSGFRGFSFVGARGFEASRLRREVSQNVVKTTGSAQVGRQLVTTGDVEHHVWLRADGMNSSL